MGGGGSGAEVAMSQCDTRHRSIEIYLTANKHANFFTNFCALQP